MSDAFAQDDAAYVLGALSDDERSAFEAHLLECADCRGRVAEIRGVPALLAGLTAADLGDLTEDEPLPDSLADSLPDTLLPGLLRRAGHRRRQQRWLVGALAGVAAACLVALAVVLLPFGSSGSSSTPQARDFVPVAATPVRANASLITKTWGTQIDVHCSYSEGVTKPFPYALRVIDDDGDSDTLGSWTVPVGHDIAYQAGTRYHLDEISKIQIVTTDGRPILELDN